MGAFLIEDKTDQIILDYIKILVIRPYILFELFNPYNYRRRHFGLECNHQILKNGSISSISGVLK